MVFSVMKIYSFFNYFFSLPQVKSNVDFLDGYRASLALWVLIGHANHNFKFYGYPFLGAGHYIGVTSFFILSAFLLTFRLIEELELSEDSLRKKILITLKYFIRRFFRIYIPFCVTAYLIKYRPDIFGGYLTYSPPLSDIIYLKDPGGNHLWTVAPEIKFYFIIPIIALFYSSTRRDKFIVKLVKLLVFYYVLCLVIEKILVSGLLFDYYKVFLNGTIVAIVYYNYSQIELFKSDCFKIFKSIFGFITMILYAKMVTLSSMAYYESLKSNYGQNTLQISYYWSLVLLLMLMFSANFFTNIFQLDILRSMGKYSFGIYLYHPMCIEIVKKTIKVDKPIRDYEYVVYTIFISYISGFLFFHLVENNLIRLANCICSKLSALKIFSKSYNL